MSKITEEGFQLPPPHETVCPLRVIGMKGDSFIGYTCFGEDCAAFRSVKETGSDQYRWRCNAIPGEVWRRIALPQP